MNNQEQVDVVIYFRRKVPSDVARGARNDTALVVRVAQEDFRAHENCLRIITRDEDGAVVEESGYPLWNVLRWSVEPCNNNIEE